MFAATGAVATGAVVVVIFNLCHYGLLLAISTVFHSKLFVDTGLIVIVVFLCEGSARTVSVLSMSSCIELGNR